MVSDSTRRAPAAYRLAYDGRRYHGFQRQPDVPTVEDTLFEALAAVGAIAGDAEVPAGYSAAGRTDAGVSAAAQTVAFEAPDWLTPVVLTDALPADIAAWARAAVPPSFHARHDAIIRHYRYHLPADGLDETRLRGARGVLSGHHDVRHLCADGSSPRRTHIAVTRAGDWFELDFTAVGFARQQVRRTVGAMRSVAAGEAPLARLGRLLASGPVPGHLAPAVAPPDPLVLVGVRYANVDFEVDPEARARARGAIRAARKRSLTRARVLDDLASGIGRPDESL
ncbi:MAG: tRNA pseudouridine synthase A [Halobacteriota archaeon]